MLEKEPVAALNEVLLSCRRAQAQYENLCSVVGDDRLKKTFLKVAGSRAQTADELEEAVKAMSSLPLDPDPEKEALESLWVKLKAALKGDEYDVLFEEVDSLEAEIKERCDRALEHPIPENAARTLNRLAEDSKQFSQRLREFGNA